MEFSLLTVTLTFFGYLPLDDLPAAFHLRGRSRFLTFELMIDNEETIININTLALGGHHIAVKCQLFTNCVD